MRVVWEGQSHGSPHRVVFIPGEDDIHPEVVVEMLETLPADALGVKATHWVLAPSVHYKHCTTLAIEKLLK